jgi:hypothetical protein
MRGGATVHRHPGRAKREPGPIDWTIVKCGRVLASAHFLKSIANLDPGRAGQWVPDIAALARDDGRNLPSPARAEGPANGMALPTEGQPPRSPNPDQNNHLIFEQNQILTQKIDQLIKN